MEVQSPSFQAADIATMPGLVGDFPRRLRLVGSLYVRMLSGVSPRRIVRLSGTISAAVLLWVLYLFSDGIVAVEKRHVTIPPSRASPVFPQDLTATSAVSSLESSPKSFPPEYYDYDVHSVVEPSDVLIEDGEDEEDVVEDEEDVLEEDGEVDEEVDEGKENEDVQEIIPVGVIENYDAYYANYSNKDPSIDFSIRKGFNFPHPKVFLSTQKIVNANWVHQLKNYLRSIHPARSLTITVATKSFIPNLLNWLIAAYRLTEPPMEHVLVLAFDKAVFSLLSSRKVPCVYIPYKSVLKKLKKGVSTIWMTRLAVIRLLNHWGYDVLQLDTDAVPLKNPHLVFDGYSEYDLVGARGVLPFELGHGPWGFTLCMGAALLRGTQKMESLWNVMHSSKMDKTTDDQKRVNFALFHSKLQWGSKEKQYAHATVGTNRDGVRVAVLPRKYVCRKTCSMDAETPIDVVVWHQSGGGHSASWKSKQNARSTVWFLRSDYDTRHLDSSLTGLAWLEQLTLPGSLENVRRKLSPTQKIRPKVS